MPDNDSVSGTGRSDRRRALRTVLTFLGLTFAFQGIVDFVSLRFLHGPLAAVSLNLLAMWSPTGAALITCRVAGKELSTLGWGWPAGRWLMAAFAIPAAYTIIAYVIVWAFGWGAVPNPELLEQVRTGFGVQSDAVAVALWLPLVGALGIIPPCAWVLGEEIGWRGLLAPELTRVLGFRGGALVGGALWAGTHYAVLIWGDYNANGTNGLYAAGCFTVLIIAMTFAMNWLRLRSDSVWTGLFFHATHNHVIQDVLTPLTKETPSTKWFIDEFGCAVAVSAVAVIALCSALRHRFEPAPQPTV